MYRVFVSYCVLSLPHSPLTPRTQSPVNYTPHHRSTQFYYRNEIISHLDTNYHLLSHICSNLETYMQSVRKLLEGVLYNLAPAIVVIAKCMLFDHGQRLFVLNCFMYVFLLQVLYS